jgi:hypothetical protein
MEEVGLGVTGMAWNKGIWFCLIGMAWIGESQFRPDLKGLEWRKTVWAELE